MTSIWPLMTPGQRSPLHRTISSVWWTQELEQLLVLTSNLQSWKKRLGQFVWFGSKTLPPFPQCNVGLSHVARGSARSPNIDWWGVGKEMTNGELGGIFKTMHCPKCPYNHEHWDNCSKVGQVSQLFFSRIVGHRHTKITTMQQYFK